MTVLSARRILRYCSHFGLKAGLSAARLHTARPGTLVRLQLPGLPHPFWARAGTSDVETFEEVFVAKEYNLPFAGFRPRHILDLGANAGYASLYFSARWPEARVLAVEPATDNIGLLHLNTKACPQIKYLQAAVWPHPAQVCLANPDDAPNAYQMSEAAGSRPDSVPAYTVTQLIDRLECETLDLLKMDVEGAEDEIFRHPEWLDRVNVMMIELHDRIKPGCAQALYAALQGRRFRQEIVGANLAIELQPAGGGSRAQARHSAEPLPSL